MSSQDRRAHESDAPAHEHVEYEAGAEELITQALFELATPECHLPLTDARVRDLRTSLSDGMGS